MEYALSGEKRLSRHIDQKVRDNERVLLDVRDEVVSLRADVNGVRADVNKLKTDVALLRADMPGIVGNAVIQALRETRRSRYIKPSAMI